MLRNIIFSLYFFYLKDTSDKVTADDDVTRIMTHMHDDVIFNLLC